VKNSRRGMATGSPLDAGVESAWRTVHTIWLGCVAFATVVWIVLPTVFPVPARAEGVGRLVTLIFLVVGAVEVAAGLRFKQRALDPQVPARSRKEVLGRLTGQSLVAAVMPQSVAVFAIVAYVMTGSRLAVSVLCGLSVLGLLLVRPRLEEWREMLHTVHIDEDRRPRG
jgi:hypothetical protein